MSNITNVKRLQISLIIFLLILVGIFLISPWAESLFWDRISNLYFQLFLKLPQIEKNLNSVTETIQKQVATPEPLRATQETPESFLTKAGVIALTNSQRAKNGLPALKENARLDESARMKAEDMLKNQYFAHTSPSGVTVSDLAGEVGYEFIAIGENLAMGNFENDEALVQAWMDSPGHRANILNTKYQEIGVAVSKGTFEGKTTWMAVQHFGLPVSVCPKPDENLKTAIDSSQNQMSAIFEELKALEAEIKSNPSRSSDYQARVKQYNDLAAQYNSLVEQNKTIINMYNSQVRAFNECVSEK